MIKSMYEIVSKTYKNKGTVSIQKRYKSPRVEITRDLVLNSPKMIIIDEIYNYGNRDFSLCFSDFIENIESCNLDDNSKGILIENNSGSKLVIEQLEKLRWQLKFINGCKGRTTIHAYAKDTESKTKLDNALQGMIACSNHKYNETECQYKRMYINYSKLTF